MLLEVDNLRVCYDSFEAIKGISFALEEGDLITLLGANGAGKSTVLKTISGLVTPASGQILLEGERLNGFPPHIIAAKGIAHVPEGRRIFPYMTVYENLKMGGYTQRSKAQFNKDLGGVHELFPRLRERAKQQAGTLSGGEQQMLAIGRALMSNPKVILMDEPSIGLSPLMIEALSEAIMKLHRGGRSIILVEQNSKVALSLANRCYVMELGNVVLEGSARDIATDDRIKEAYLGG